MPRADYRFSLGDWARVRQGRGRPLGRSGDDRLGWGGGGRRGAPAGRGGAGALGGCRARLPQLTRAARGPQWVLCKSTLFVQNVHFILKISCGFLATNVPDLYGGTVSGAVLPGISNLVGGWEANFQIPAWVVVQEWGES